MVITEIAKNSWIRYIGRRPRGWSTFLSSVDLERWSSTTCGPDRWQNLTPSFAHLKTRSSVRLCSFFLFLFFFFLSATSLPLIFSRRLRLLLLFFLSFVYFTFQSKPSSTANFQFAKTRGYLPLLVFQSSRITSFISSRRFLLNSIVFLWLSRNKLVISSATASGERRREMYALETRREIGSKSVESNSPAPNVPNGWESIGKLRRWRSFHHARFTTTTTANYYHHRRRREKKRKTTINDTRTQIYFVRCPIIGRVSKRRVEKLALLWIFPVVANSTCETVNDCDGQSLEYLFETLRNSSRALERYLRPLCPGNYYWSGTRREFFSKILYKNIAIIAIQLSKIILFTPLVIFTILLSEIHSSPCRVSHFWGKFSIKI